MKITITVATRNKNKLREIEATLGETFLILACPETVEEVDETAETYEGNARLKAESVSKYVRTIVAADDTGIEVDFLKGAPGVYSARFAGPSKNSTANCELLLSKLQGLDRSKRAARYRTVVVGRLPDGREIVNEGICEGWIAEEFRGRGGFGYDPIFIPTAGDGRSFAEMTLSEKGEVSHRAIAFRQLGSSIIRLTTI